MLQSKLIEEMIVSFMNKIRARLLVLVCIIPSTLGAQTCVEGLAGSFPCDNVDLLAWLTPTELLAEAHNGSMINDLWGWTDAGSGKEYVIVGMTNGTSFVDISDPSNPIMLGILPEHHEAESSRENDDGSKSIWRDIKVYQDHAFIVSEDQGHGMQVFDLTDLRDVSNPPEVFQEAGHYDGLSSAHNIVINEETGYAYAVGVGGGSNCSLGGLHIINIQNPTNPTYEACFDGDGYTHDAQCVIYHGSDSDYVGSEVCFNSNEDTITIVDVTDKENIQMISRTGYAGAFYTHQGWLTDDHNYFLSNDELDEYYYPGRNTKTLIWDVRDLDAPVRIGEFVHSTLSIDHNLYISGDNVYESNYTSGLRILDISDVENANLKQVGFFDTYPPDDNPEFLGTWSNYPFFESGVVAVSDFTSGLFLLRPWYNAFVIEQPKDITSCIGETVEMSVEVVGEGATYEWQINTGAGFEEIIDLTAYPNTTTNTLQITEVEFSQNLYQFRCKISTLDERTYYSNAAVLEIIDEIIPDFDYSIVYSKVVFTNTSYASSSYSWDFGDGSALDTSESPAHHYDETMEYTVTLTASNECNFDSVSKTVYVVVTGLESNGSKTHPGVYPVPANSWISLESGLQDYSTFIIYELNGKVVLNGRITADQKRIQIDNLNRGIYIIQFQGEFKIPVTQRIVIDQ